MFFFFKRIYTYSKGYLFHSRSQFHFLYYVLYALSLIFIFPPARLGGTECFLVWYGMNVCVCPRCIGWNSYHKWGLREVLSSWGWVPVVGSVFYKRDQRTSLTPSTSLRTQGEVRSLWPRRGLTRTLAVTLVLNFQPRTVRTGFTVIQSVVLLWQSQTFKNK